MGEPQLRVTRSSQGCHRSGGQHSNELHGMFPLYPAAFPLTPRLLPQGIAHLQSNPPNPRFQEPELQNNHTKRQQLARIPGTSPQPTPLCLSNTRSSLVQLFSSHPAINGCRRRLGEAFVRSTKISFRDQDKLNWFLARPAQRWVTPQIQLLICPLYSLSSHPQRKRK